ncbi:A disintegrin and metalloproteinase with thrombospondin motifs 1, partial [Plakobranchus ocellatus]
WVEYKGECNATTEMALWYTYIAEAIKIRFETIDKSVLDITTVVNFLRILTNETDDDFIEVLINSGTFSGSTGLENFTTWYQDPANNISNADHYMYFTGFDISSASGIAYVGTTCTVYGVSLVENGFTAGTAVIASHELGHSLSSVHDSETGGNCSDYTENIMAAIFSLPVNDTIYAGNPWRFSNCSIDSFKTYLATTSCTEPGNTGSTDVLPAPTGSALAGLVLTKDQQCKLSYRNDSSYYCKWCLLGFCVDVQTNIPGAGGTTTATTAQPATSTTAPPTTTTTAPPTATTIASSQITTNPASTASESTAAPTTTNTASTASKSTAVPTTTSTASTASESTAAPTTTLQTTTELMTTTPPYTGPTNIFQCLRYLPRFQFFSFWRCLV